MVKMMIVKREIARICDEIYEGLKASNIILVEPLVVDFLNKYNCEDAGFAGCTRIKIIKNAFEKLEFGNFFEPVNFFDDYNFSTNVIGDSLIIVTISGKRVTIELSFDVFSGVVSIRQVPQNCVSGSPKEAKAKLEWLKLN